MIKQWNIKRDYVEGDNILKILLENRGINEISTLEEFLNPPKISYWINKLPSEFKDSLLCAKQLVRDSISKNLPIIVHGDYDADGVCATTILYEVFKNELKHENTHYFIPNRFKHGYGLSTKSLKEVSEKYGPGLLITVDSGITAVAEVAQAKDLGFKIIITDHHQKPDPLPAADCIVWSDTVVGSTLAWILGRVLGSQNPYSVALAAVATITDLQPVVGFNRTIVKIGLEIVNTHPPMGLKKMFESAGKMGSRITTYELGWLVGPRLNASGRLVEAEDSVKLLLEKDEETAMALALKLNTVNVTRQDKTLEMFELASDFDPENVPKIIFSAKQEYHEGIIGLVASKLVQKYYRPTVVVSIFEENAKGSVRSIEGVNIIQVLREAEHLFDSLGGHPMAAGFSIKTNRLDELKDHLAILGEKHVKTDLLTKKLNIDLKIPIEMVNLDLYQKILQLEPFGIGNEEPVFVSSKISVSGVDRVGRDAQHLSVKLYNAGKMYKAIWFNAGEFAGGYKTGDLIDVAYTLNRNDYQGKTYIDLVVKDAKRSQ